MLPWLYVLYMFTRMKTGELLVFFSLVGVGLYLLGDWAMKQAAEQHSLEGEHESELRTGEWKSARKPGARTRVLAEQRRVKRRAAEH